jgi:hypothetical protein
MPSEYALRPEQLAELQEASSKVERFKSHAKTQPKRVSLRPEAFVMLPYAQTLEVAGRLGGAAAAVMAELAYLAFRAHRSQVILANAALQAVGVSPDAKVRALRRLEAAGMVAVDWRGPGRSPLVTLLWKATVA